jgi:hypothetical protein
LPNPGVPPEYVVAFELDSSSSSKELEGLVTVFGLAECFSILEDFQVSDRMLLAASTGLLDDDLYMFPMHLRCEERWDRDVKEGDQLF